MLLLLLAAAPVIVDTHADTTFYLVEEKLDLLKPARKDVHLDIAKGEGRPALGRVLFDLRRRPLTSATSPTRRSLTCSR